MCGFTIGQGSDPDVNAVSGSIRTLSHRGPDDEGVRIDQASGVVFSHCRLSIIDREGGEQPMYKKGVMLAFNGEIYNYRELRTTLERNGHSFQTESDTEVLLESYRRWGPDCLDRLRGMFAFALRDEEREHLFLARDRFGQKPLYYAETGDNFYASSEIQGLLPVDDVSRTLDPGSLPLYLGLQYVPSPRTGFRDVEKLPPASYAIVKGGEVVEKDSYWSLSYKDRSDRSFRDAQEEIRDRLRESVRLRMRSDVPVGAFLSGGIDSSIIVSLMSRESEEAVRTFSIGFDYDDFDELPYARSVADRYDTDHHEFQVTASIRELLPELVQHFGEPFADSSAVPVYYVSRETRREVKVALTGDGGDELFGGYGLYEKMAWRQMLRQIIPGVGRPILGEVAHNLPHTEEGRSWWNKGVLALKHLEGPAGVWYAFLASYFSENQLKSLFKNRPEGQTAREFCREEFEQFSHLASEAEQAMAFDASRYLPEDLLLKVDIASMMNSLECRSPFLDRNVAEFAASLPYRFKMGRLANQKKRVLREAFREDLPESVLNHRKTGFGIPRDEWLRGELNDYVRELLLGKNELFDEYFDRSFIRNLVERHTAREQSYGSQIWALLVLGLWYETMDVRLP